MKTSKAARKLIDDAKAAGCRVAEERDRVDINKGKTMRSVGITIWPDGTATRNDCDFDLCKAIRTVKQMREILGL